MATHLAEPTPATQLKEINAKLTGEAHRALDRQMKGATK